MGSTVDRGHSCSLMMLGTPNWQEVNRRPSGVGPARTATPNAKRPQCKAARLSPPRLHVPCGWAVPIAASAASDYCAVEGLSTPHKNPKS